MGDIVPRKSVAKYATKAAGGIVGGIVIIILKTLPFVPALIIGGIVALIGFSLSRSREDTVAGYIIGAAGILIALGGIPIIGGIAGFLLTVSGIGLIVAGGINLFRFFKGLRSRSY